MVLNERTLYQRQLLLLILVIIFVVLFSAMTIAILIMHPNREEVHFEGKKNILLIVVDDLRPTLGCYGDERAITPNIDRLASKGMLFSNAYAQQALCAPSRTSFLTSRRPDSLHIYGDYSYWRETVGNFVTLPQHFKENGYETMSIGKIFHHGSVSNNTDDYPYSWSHEPFRPSTMKYKMKPVCPSSDGESKMNLMCPVDVDTQPEKTLPDLENTKHAMDFLKNRTNSSIPFFLGVGFYKPHIPFKFPKEYLDLYPLDTMDLAPNASIPVRMPKIAWNPWTDIRERDDVKQLNASFPYGPLPEDFQKIARQGYYASVSYLDDQVGHVLQELEDSGYAEHTTVVFMSDHGWSLGEHQEWSKYSNFEVSLRVPLIIYIPELMKSKTAEHVPFKYQNVLDLIPPAEPPKNIPKYETVPANSPDSVKHVMKRDTIIASSKNNTKLQNLVKTLDITVKSIPKATLRSLFIPKYKTDELVELVDIFPTLSEIANIATPPLCRVFSSLFCSEGLSFYPVIEHVVTDSWVDFSWKTAVFSQYPRPSLVPGNNSDQPDLDDIRYMGYTIRTPHYRYTEWVRFDVQTFKPDWPVIISRELYNHRRDPFEAVNLCDEEEYANIVIELSTRLKKGWRHAMPPGMFDTPRHHHYH